MTRKSTRRKFLRDSTLAGVGFWVAGASTGLAAKGPNDKIHFAGIGVGGKGHGDITQAGALGPVVAICDIDERHLDKTEADLKKAGHTPKRFFDYRKMLEEMGSQIDAVTVSTPDHTHAPASVMAMKMKKHVYCQKPLTHSVYEARRMRELAAEMKVCTQMGNQGTSDSTLRRAVEIIRAGVLGQVKEVHVWTNRPIWPQGAEAILKVGAVRSLAMAALHGQSAELKLAKAPPHVHWDEFLGPAQPRPYDPIYHPFSWRGWWDFGTGALGDMACHTANLPFMALKLGMPVSVAPEDVSEVNAETCPTHAKVAIYFPEREGLAPVKFTWYEGQKGGRKLLPPEALFDGHKAVDSGSMMIGEKGTMYSPNDNGGSYVFLGKNAKDLEAAAQAVPTTLPRNGKGDQGMKNEWVEAMRQNKPEIAMSNFAYAGMLTEAILLGNVAMRVGRKFEWNGPELKATDCPAAAQFIKGEYRRGWEV